MNKAILMGNLGADAELTHHDTGARLRFRLATTESYKDKDGERKDRTNWHTVVMWGQRAEAIQRYLTKGRTVLVEGSIESRAFEDAQGVKQRYTEIRAHDIRFAGGAPRKTDASASVDGLDLDAVEAELRSRDYTAAQATA
jgi:single-strand DNA-binding protein